MGTLNVNRGVTDAFYRYKMPRLMAKVEGKGNGIKTVIVNMTDVAKALNRPPTYPTKYFGCELGAQTQFDFKNDRYIVNGSHEAVKLQDMLDGFIKKFVLCPQCDNPETQLHAHNKKQVITQNCKACGYQGTLIENKLTTFILKNPPDQDPTALGSSLATPSKGKTKGKGKKCKTNGESHGDDDGGSPNQKQSDDDEMEADDDDWSVDVSEEAVKRRMLELSDCTKGLTINQDLEKSEKERLDILYEYVKKLCVSGSVQGMEKEIQCEAERLDVKDKASLILCELLFNENILAQAKQHRILLLRFTHGNPKAQRYFLGGLEQLIGLYKDQLLPKIPHIFKMFYDMDILEEECLLEWGKKASKKYISRELSVEIHQKAEAFIKWLQEAEEEEESDEDGVEIDYDDRARVTSIKEQPRVVASTVTPVDDVVDDVDIDAI